MNPQPHRPRRLRSHPFLRDILAHTRLAPSDFVAPLFIRSGKNQKIPVPSMPGVHQLSPDTAITELKRLQSLGVAAYLLFGVTDQNKKDALGSHAHNPDNEVCTTLKLAKDAGINMLAITDLCYCEYTIHGHCGPLTPFETVDNDLTTERLGQQAVLHARSGADIVAPSGMMDNMIHAIRSALDADNKPDTAILSYAVKYASAFYGPFRDAAESPPQFGDRKTYQMNYKGAGDPVKEALREAQIDVDQGADIIMVKPGLPYLDILKAVTDTVPVPTATYHVSGEYAMLKAAAQNNWIDEKSTVLETMHAFKRAGASMILTYYAADLAEWLA
jgi:porphobilinogen synthase